MKQTFFLNEHGSPTEINLTKQFCLLGWKKNSTAETAHFNARYFAFHEEAATCLEYKHLLAEFTQKYCAGMMPLTYCVNEWSWPHVLGYMADKTYAAPPVWIVKPSLLNNGQHVQIFTSFKALFHFFSSSKRLLGDYVIQQYITHPHLLNDRRKYTVRLFLILLSHAGAFLYREGYANVSSHRYEVYNFQNMAAHLTNEHLAYSGTNVIQIPFSRFPFYNRHYQCMKEILSTLSVSLKSYFPQAFNEKLPPTFAIFGADFLMDVTGRCWLLEMNHGPCFPTREDHPLQAVLYDPFWRTLTSACLMPMTENKSPTDSFFNHFDRL